MENPQLIFSWKAPLRPYKKRAALVLRFYLAVALLLSLIVFFFGDKILLIPIWAVLFLFYVLTITPPPEVENKITRFGIETTGITLRWESLSHFYFTERFGFYVLTMISHAPYFYHAYLVVPSEEIKKNLLLILSEHLVYQDQPQLSFTDKAINWFSQLIPDEEERIDVMKTSHPISSSKPQPASL
ncbi:hypothetical protein A2774_04990 [Candidatus Roizmanbacteria bacterium RIFCSPHIGHO2_01_FULL_39_12c]|uniref:DUF5673 domain-containing protein n=1 Tax=Candidatus Roizmanbacteria bacterium RIFCSPHIGHO2_01_FULL_39_12c TaxID=1802031 RepID=A0A1F7G966_9BACT|nr:MAG: hypothetical protein A2774_04990 [Candidatus Roizmanbacteria bacterium RIFCSPHIGHO2_01_FULL_39_12c]OGK46491.1 MAG: hypothetical protein A2963_01845 [Candidatus Roizmanbacteria bacterium RIFCSPLOWO2_01_FULL_40_13]